MADVWWNDDPLRPLDADEEASGGPRFSGRFRVAALLITVFFLGLSVLSASTSLFKTSPPTPERTRPLPAAIPTQGAVR